MFIDMHVHTVTSCDLPVAPGEDIVATPAQLLEMLDAAGIDRAVVLPLVTPENCMTVQSNEDVFEIADKHPDRFIPFCNIDRPPSQELGGDRHVICHQSLQAQVPLGLVLGFGLCGLRGGLCVRLRRLITLGM